VQWPLPALLAISAGLAACAREQDEPLPPDVVDEAPAPKPWLNVPITEGEEGCELRQIERMLNANCGACHSMPNFYPCIDCLGDSWGEPLRISSLIELGKITPGDADASRVMIRLNAGEMPPPISGLAPMSTADVSWLASFIDTLEPEAALACPPGASR
jgi:hypothetical protein